MVAGGGRPETTTSGSASARPSRRRGVTDDAVVRLREERAVVERDPRAACVPARGVRAEAGVHVGSPVTVGVLECNQKTPGMRRRVAVIAPAPGV